MCTAVHEEQEQQYSLQHLAGILTWAANTLHWKELCCRGLREGCHFSFHSLGTSRASLLTSLEAGWNSNCPGVILKLPPGNHQHTSVWQRFGCDMYFPAYTLFSGGEIFTYMCICIITYIDLWKETISLVSSSCYCQAPAIVIPQASWQLLWLMVASIKMNFLQKATIPPLFSAVHEAACIARGFVS